MFKAHLVTISIVFLLACFKCAKKEEANKYIKTSTKMSTVSEKKPIKIGFVLTDGFYTTEFTAPLDVFNHATWSNELVEVFSVSERGAVVTSAEGVKVVTDYSFENAPKPDILVIPSGSNTVILDLKNEKLINFVKDKGRTADYLLSLCEGAFILGKTGFLHEKNATTYPSSTKNLKEKFPDTKVHSGVSFVHDGKVITSTGEAKSFEAALYLTEILFGEETANEIAEGLLLDRRWKDAHYLKSENEDQ